MNYILDIHITYVLIFISNQLYLRLSLSLSHTYTSITLIVDFLMDNIFNCILYIIH